MVSIVTFLLMSCILFISNGYYLSLSILEWKNASRFCQSYCNSNLISIHNQSQYTDVLQLINNNNYIFKDVWIGLNDHKISDQWVWSDGSPLDYGSNLDGRYPWRRNEPDPGALDHSVAIEATSDNLWADKEHISNFHFLCGSCSSQLTKYVAINGFSTYSEASKQCEEHFGTTLASIHSVRDMEEAISVCKSVTNIAGCWIGLNNNQIPTQYQWDDGTAFDFGVTPNTYPWYHTKSGFSPGQNCIQMDPEPEQYLWDDANCNITGRILCNAPSEICEETQFFISNEMKSDQWIFTKTPCTLTSNLINTDVSVAIIGNKQYYNSNGILFIDMMYTMVDLGAYGNSGVAFYFDERNCNNFYLVGMWAGYDLLFLGKFVDDIWEILKTAHIGMVFDGNVYYNLQIKLTNGIDWSVKLNDKFMFNISDVNDTFNNIANKYSGYIGIRNSNTSMIIKSLFISGDPVYIDSNLLYLSCNNISTMSPTMDPTIPPTLRPTRMQYDAAIDTTTSTMIFIDDNNDNVLDNELELVTDLNLFWIIAVPVIFILICFCVSYSVNKYCCDGISDDESVEGEEEENLV